MALETRAVLGAATPNHGTPLTHTVHIPTGEQEPALVLCLRVRLSHLADVHATDPTARPTCPRCLARDYRFRDLNRGTP